MNLQALHKLGYGMYIVCSINGDKINGQISNTVFQITSEPPTVAVSINKSNLTHEYIQNSKVFTASVLCTETPLSYIGRFGFHSGRDANKFDEINYKTGKTGAPIVTHYTVAYMEAKVAHEIDVGTHTLFIGEIVEADVISERECMTYAHYHEVKRGTTPTSAPSYIKEN
ncbi:flavin reductase family protein [Chloroflexota bacterium]